MFMGVSHFNFSGISSQQGGQQASFPLFRSRGCKLLSQVHCCKSKQHTKQQIHYKLGENRKDSDPNCMTCDEWRQQQQSKLEVDVFGTSIPPVRNKLTNAVTKDQNMRQNSSTIQIKVPHKN